MHLLKTSADTRGTPSAHLICFSYLQVNLTPQFIQVQIWSSCRIKTIYLFYLNLLKTAWKLWLNLEKKGLEAKQNIAFIYSAVCMLQTGSHSDLCVRDIIKTTPTFYFTFIFHKSLGYLQKEGILFSVNTNDRERSQERPHHHISEILLQHHLYFFSVSFIAKLVVNALKVLKLCKKNINQEHQVALFYFVRGLSFTRSPCYVFKLLNSIILVWSFTNIQTLHSTFLLFSPDLLLPQAP